MPFGKIATSRLDLVPATGATLEAELAGADALAHALGVAVPADWPPPLYDEPAIRWTLERMRNDPRHADWGFHYFVLRGGRDGDRSTAIGAGGYKGPPGEDRTVEIGYSVVPAWQRRGFATEAARGLVAAAFEDPGVDVVAGETLPELVASIRVMEAAGLRRAGGGSEPGVIRFEIRRHGPR